MSTIKIRRASLDDSRDIFDWRNDDDSRFYSTQTEVITWQNHCVWYENCLVNSNTYVLVGNFVDGNKIGVVRFNLSSTFALVSININPLFRGKNLSIPLLSLSIKYFWTLHNLSLRAKIKPNNIASIKCFTGCGFKFNTTKDNLNEYYLETISPSDNSRIY